ncbi:MAG TPA: peptidylprolyl isomerase, partial [Thermoanaerobaculia bacterium]|nr:peptidylprolyl isomerase [Thermoanaerobaculia bacterium]
AKTGKTIFEAKAKSPVGRLGLDHVDSYASSTGFRLKKSAQYQLISVYDNPLDHNVDSMASMFFGAVDPEFVKPTSAELAGRAKEYAINVLDAVAVIRTSKGDFGVEMMRDAAPEAVKQFLRLARNGAYNGGRISLTSGGIRFAPPTLTPAQKQMLRRLPVESGMKHDGGTLSLCGSEPEFTLVVRNEPTRDGRCSAFARVGPGAAVVRALSAARDGEELSITKVDVFEDKTEAATTELAPVKTAAR